jgi:predicted Zn-dependent peptidase
MVNVVLALNLGSKDETPATSGYVHILEHLILFASTRDHHFLDLQDHARQQALTINAHTDQDLIIVDCRVLPDRLAAGLRFLREKVFTLAPREEELQKEIRVILQEIGNLEDQPDQVGVFQLLRDIFAGHPYGQPVSGDPQVITNARLPDLQTFIDTYLHPGNCALTLVGDLQPGTILPLVEEIFGGLPPGKIPARTIPSAPFPGQRISRRHTMDIQSGHLFIGFRAPGMYHPDQLAFNLLVQILGRGSNPLIYQALRQNRGLSANVSVYYYALARGGALIIHLKTEPRLLDSATRTTLAFLTRLNQVRFSREDYLLRDRYRAPDLIRNARMLFERRYHRAMEKGMTAARDLALDALFGHLHPSPSAGSLDARLEAIDTARLREIADRYFGDHPPILLTITPRGTDDEK